MASFYKFLILSTLISLTHGVTVDLIRRDSSSTKTRFERFRNAVDRSFTRKSSLLSTSSKLQSTDASLSAAGGEFLIEYQIGTPPVRQLSIADTGSDLTWIQCKPCTNCYKQDYPLFDPTATTTYRPVACGTSQCAASGGASACGVNDVCQYQVAYGDRSHSDGDLAADTLTLGANASFPTFIFGCGKDNAGTFRPDGSGIFGLGNGPVSIVNQKKSSIGGRFSYCLTAPDSNVSSKISFGSDAIVAGASVVSTPIISKDPDTFYYLTLEGLSVGDEKFEYSKKVNVGAEQVSGSEGNIIIDSGTTLTFVPQELYQGIEASLEKAIKGTPVKDSQGTFNLCYQLSQGGDFSSPPITAHFEGADVVLPLGSTFLEVEQGLVCLTVLPSSDLAIFGNLHQEGYLIGYDIVGQKLNFLKTDCTKSH